MATLFMSKAKASAKAAPVDRREALSLERHAGEDLAKRAQIEALRARREEEAAKVRELQRAIPDAETVLSDIEVVRPDDHKAIAPARRALERLTQELKDSQRRDGALTRAIEAMMAELEPLKAAAADRIGAAGKALHQAAVTDMARKFRAIEGAIAYEEEVRNGMVDAFRALDRNRDLTARYIRSLGYRLLGGPDDKHGGTLRGWFDEARQFGYDVDD